MEEMEKAGIELELIEGSHLMLTTFGKLTRENVTEIFDGFESEVIHLQRLDGKRLLLVDVTKMISVDAGGRKVIFERLYGLGFDRIAVYGQSSYIKYLINFIIIGLRMTDKIRYFESADQAVIWLNPV